MSRPMLSTIASEVSTPVSFRRNLFSYGGGKEQEWAHRSERCYVPKLYRKAVARDGAVRGNTAYKIMNLVVETCKELTGGGRTAGRADLSRYGVLHEDGKRLITGWFERAWEARDCEPEESFEPFVFAFIALNAWASCVTGLDNDTQWRNALALDPVVSGDFSRLVTDPSSAVSTPAREFQRLWPVFKVQGLRRLGIGPVLGGEGRRELVDHYLTHPRAGSLRFEPGCWRRHRQAGEQVPLDWAHTLFVLYRVRCNLFHGEKARHSEMDQQIVSAALRVLVNFLGSTGYLNNRLFDPS